MVCSACHQKGNIEQGESEHDGAYQPESQRAAACLRHRKSNRADRKAGLNDGHLVQGKGGLGRGAGPAVGHGGRAVRQGAMEIRRHGRGRHAHGARADAFRAGAGRPQARGRTPRAHLRPAQRGRPARRPSPRGKQNKQRLIPQSRRKQPKRDRIQKREGQNPDERARGGVRGGRRGRLHAGDRSACSLWGLRRSIRWLSTAAFLRSFWRSSICMWRKTCPT